MSAIKLHLEQSEYDAVARFANAIHVKPEAVLYSALNRLMLDSRNPQLPTEIEQTWAWHRANLPLWSDSACSVHAYEGKADDEPEPGPMFQTAPHGEATEATKPHLTIESP